VVISSSRGKGIKGHKTSIRLEHHRRGKEERWMMWNCMQIVQGLTKQIKKTKECLEIFVLKKPIDTRI